jgi:hypothetical protein
VLLGDLPDWMDVDFLHTAAGALVVVAIFALLIAVFMFKSIAARVLVVVLLGAAVVGLLRYRETLDHCDKTGCACKFLGEDVKGGGCATSG